MGRGPAGDGMEIGDLLDRCRAGDELAWEALVRQFQGRVHGLALLYLGEREEARDCAQDVFIRVYRRLDDCRDAATFLPWLLRVTRNAAIDRQRRRRARPSGRSVPLEEAAGIPGPGPDPAEELGVARMRDRVRAALDRLGGLNREIVILKEIQGLSFESVAGILGIPVGTAKSRSNRARLELARLLAGPPDAHPAGRDEGRS
jgi:RNA polymerase sigma-70 factor, ECF subfamily